MSSAKPQLYSDDNKFFLLYIESERDLIDIAKRKITIRE